jgi:hypothetical protein
MRAWYNGCGVRISLNLKDKESVERKKTLEAEEELKLESEDEIEIVVPKKFTNSSDNE